MARQEAGRVVGVERTDGEHLRDMFEPPVEPLPVGPTSTHEQGDRGVVHALCDG